MSNEQLQLKGVWPVIPTPLDNNEMFDPEGLAAIIEYAIAHTFHGVLILGSNGEATYFSHSEKCEIFATAGQVLRNRLPWMAGILEHSTREALQIAEAAEKSGASALLVALPTYYPLKFEQALHHLRKIVKETDLPVLYYHFPTCTHLHLSPQEVGRLCYESGAVGIKESILNLPHMRTHLRLSGREGFALFTGTSYLLKECLELGGAGVICPIPLIVPETVLSLYHAMTAEKRKDAEPHVRKLFDTFALVSGKPLPSSLSRTSLPLLAKTSLSLKTSGVENLPALIKEALRQKGVPITARVRSPLPRLTTKQKKAIRQLLKRRRDENYKH